MATSYKAFEEACLPENDHGRRWCWVIHPATNKVMLAEFLGWTNTDPIRAIIEFDHEHGCRLAPLLDVSFFPYKPGTKDPRKQS